MKSSLYTLARAVCRARLEAEAVERGEKDALVHYSEAVEELLTEATALCVVKGVLPCPGGKEVE